MLIIESFLGPAGCTNVITSMLVYLSSVEDKNDNRVFGLTGGLTRLVNTAYENKVTKALVGCAVKFYFV